MKLDPEMINGTMIQYYRVCQKKLWYFVHNLQMEQNSENVSIGRSIHDYSYQRNKLKEIELDSIVKFDRIDNKFIYEIKKSRAIDEAHVLQMKFYLWYLRKRGIDGLKGKLQYPLLKETHIVELSDEDSALFEEIQKDILAILGQETPPHGGRSKLCRKCAYEELCWS